MLYVDCSKNSSKIAENNKISGYLFKSNGKRKERSGGALRPWQGSKIFKKAAIPQTVTNYKIFSSFSKYLKVIQILLGFLLSLLNSFLHFKKAMEIKKLIFMCLDKPKLI